MAKVQTVKSILFYYIIDTKLLRTGIARTALHLRLHARLCPLLLLHRSACSLPYRSRTPARGGYSSLLVFTSPTVFPLLPRSIPNLPRNLPRKPPRNLSLHFLLRQAYTVKTYTEVSAPFTPPLANSQRPLANYPLSPALRLVD